MSNKGNINVNLNTNANINNVRIGNDIFGIGEAIHSIPDTISAIGSCVKDVSEGYENIAHTTGNIIESALNLFNGNPNLTHSNKELKNGGNYDIRKQSLFAVENMRDIELKKNIFSNCNARFQQIDSTLQNQGIRIGVLENKVENHEISG